MGLGALVLVGGCITRPEGRSAPMNGAPDHRSAPGSSVLEFARGRAAANAAYVGDMVFGAWARVPAK